MNSSGPYPSWVRPIRPDARLLALADERRAARDKLRPLEPARRPKVAVASRWRETLALAVGLSIVCLACGAFSVWAALYLSVNAS
jgi:hypothetical protein